MSIFTCRYGKKIFTRRSNKDNKRRTHRCACLSCGIYRLIMLHSELPPLKFCELNPFRMKTPKYSFPRGNEPLLYHQIGKKKKSLQISKTCLFCVDKIKYEHLAILSNLKSCQFALRIVIFNLCICCQFEDLQIISPKIIPMSLRNI